MSSEERYFSCFCNNLAGEDETYEELYGSCQFCYDEIEAQECATQFFRNECKYKITTLCELEEQIQKLNEDVASLREHLKLYIKDIGGVK